VTTASGDIPRQKEGTIATSLRLAPLKFVAICETAGAAYANLAS